MAENKFKVLIIDYTQNIYTIFNKKPEKNAIKIENIYLLNKFYKTDSNKYNIVIFDNPQISFLKKTELLNNSTNIFLSECNLLGIKKLSKYRNLLQRDKSMGVLELEADATDLFTSVMRNIKKDFSSGNYDNNISYF